VSGGGGRGPLAADDLIGSWLLRSWVLTLDDGSQETPFGAEPQGLVVYTPDGRMITTIGLRGRPSAGSDLSSVSDEARLAAIRTFVAYSGTFTIDGEDVVHAVEMSLDPAWVGTQQRRHVELSDDGRTLILSTDPLLVVGRRGRHRLTWERVTS
jgi:hypothetical protein